MLSRRGLIAGGLGTALLSGLLPASGRAGKLETGLQPMAGRPLAPPIALTGLNGETRTLESAAGKPAIIAFWATWCSPCRVEIPMLARLRAERAADALTVFAVNYGEPRAKVEAFLTEIGLDDADGAAGMFLLDEKKTLMAPWRVGLLPLSYLVTSTGHIAYRVVGEFDWEGEEARAAIERLSA